MKREKFLWPLTQGHHGALVAARNVRERLSLLKEGETGSLLELSREVRLFFMEDLEGHFQGEENELLKVFSNHVGPEDPDVKKILEDHRSLRALSKSMTKGELQLFADSLTAHVRFEEDVFFPRVEKMLTEEEKIIETEKLLTLIPSETHCPLPPGKRAPKS
jgi:hemerythrin-like domain-containing protein